MAKVSEALFRLCDRAVAGGGGGGGGGPGGGGGGGRAKPRSVRTGLSCIVRIVDTPPPRAPVDTALRAAGGATGSA